MKNIENKRLSVSGQEMKYATLASTCIHQNIPQGGFSLDEQRSRLRLLDVIEKAEGTISLEDSDAKKLLDIVVTMKWGVISREIDNFVSDIESSLK